MTVSKLPHADGAGARAAEQAAAYDGVFASTLLELDDGTTIEIPPHPHLGLLGDEQQEAYEELLFEVEGYDRHPDVYIPEQTLASGVVLPAETRRAELKIPHRKDGVLVKPPYRTRMVQIALGPQAYAQLCAGGKDAADVIKIWTKGAARLEERRQSDSKSA